MVFSTLVLSSVLAVQLVPPLPAESANRLTLIGNPTENQGLSAFFNLDPSAPDFGHRDISKNASGNGAPYYATGRQGSPEVPASGATRTATVTGTTSFPNFSSYLTSNGISPSSIGLVLGQKSDRSFTQTWNLGDDILGKNWFASPDSTIEERIYAANPDDVELFLSYGTNKILDFEYSDLYTVFDYGPTQSPSDDRDLAFTNPIGATKVAGLESLTDGLANAFLQDVANAGGKVQIVSDDRQVTGDTAFATGNGFGIVNLPFTGYIQVASSVSVPEKSSALGLLMLGALFAISQVKKQKQKRMAD
jgi:hypothetical protein